MHRDKNRPDSDIVIPDKPGLTGRGKMAARFPGGNLTEAIVAEYSLMLVITFLVVSLGRGVLPVVGYVSVGLLFLLAVTLGALWFRRGAVLLMAALSALSWNFFFIEPHYTFFIARLQDTIMFGMFFIVAITMGHLTTRLREREEVERERQKLTAALLRVTQSAALSADPKIGLA